MSICKFIIEYEPHERSQAVQYIQGDDAFIVLAEIDNYLRGRIKYAELGEEAVKELEDARKELWDNLQDRGINNYVHI